MQIFDCNWINTIKQVWPSKSFRTVNGWVGVEGWWWGGGGGLFHKVYHCNKGATYTIALLYYDVASLVTFSFLHVNRPFQGTWGVNLKFVGMKHVRSPLVYMQFILACDLFRHCLEVVRLIQISLSSFKPLERETEEGADLADINDKGGISSKLI